MALGTLSNVVKDPSNAPVGGVTVRVRLRPGPGFRADQSEVATEVDVTSDAVTGAWSVAVERNPDITPAGTWYEVVEEIPPANGGPRSYAVSVAGVGGSVQASLVVPTLGSGLQAYLTQAAADGRYQALGPVGGTSLTNVTPGVARSEGVLTVGAREDHLHALVNPYKAKAYNLILTALANNAVTLVSITGTSFDPNSNVAGNAYTCPVTGYYQVNAAVQINSASAAGIVAVQVNRNAALQMVSDPSRFNAGDNPGASISDVIFCTAGDTITLLAFQLSGATQNTFTGAARTFLSVHLLST